MPHDISVSSPIRVSNPLLIRTLVLILSLIVPFAANMYLPSLPSLAKHLGSTDEIMEFTITSFLFGFGASQLIYGPLSDRFGRRKVLFIGCLIAFSGSILCALAHTGGELILGRFVLGCGVGANSVITRSILRDTFSGITLIKVASQNGAIFSIAPIFAPLLGGLLEKWFGWEAAFVAIAIFIGITAVIVYGLLSETNHQFDSLAIKPKQILKNYWYVFSHKIFLAYMLCAGFAIAGMNAYLTITPFMFEEKLGMSALEFGVVTTIVVSGMVLGRIFNSILLDHFSSRKILRFGIIIMLLSGISMFICSLNNSQNIYTVMIPSFFFIAGSSFVMPIAYSQSLEPFAKFTGFAGALYGGLTTLFSFVTSGIVAAIDSPSPLILAITYILLAVAMLFTLRLL